MEQSSARLVILRLAQSGAGILSSVLGTIFIFIVVARALDPGIFGLFAMTYAMASLCGIVFDFGYVTRLLRETAPLVERHGGLPARVVHTKLALLVVLSPLLMLVGWVADVSLPLLAILWLGIGSLSVGNLFGTMLRSADMHLRDSAHLLIANALGAALAVGLAAGLAGDDVAPEAFALAVALIGVTYAGLTLRAWRRFFAIAPEGWSVACIAGELRRNLSYALDVFTQRSFGFLDVAILAAVASPVAVGLYQAGQKIAQGASIFAQPFNNVILPRLSRAADQPRRWRALALRFAALQVGMGVLAFAGLSLAGPMLVDLLYTEDYSQVRGYMWLFGALIGARYAASSLAIMVTSRGLQAQRSAVNLTSLACFAVAAYGLAGAYGAYGMIAAATGAALLSAAGFALVLLTNGLRTP